MKQHRGPTIKRGHVRVAAVDDQPAILHGVVAGLAAVDREIDVVYRAQTVDELVTAAPEVDVIILDLMLADGSQPEGNVARLQSTGHPVLVYSQDRRQAVIQRVIRAGAMGVVAKTERFEALATAVRTVAAGQPYFSPDWALALASDPGFAPELSGKERETLELYSSGLPLKSVALRLGTSESTVREHLNRLKAKYDEVGRPAHNKVDLYVRAIEDGYLPPPGTA